MDIDALTAWAWPISEAISTGYPCAACGAAWNTAGNELTHIGDCSFLRAVEIIDEHDRSEDDRLARGD